jgi:AAA domain
MATPRRTTQTENRAMTTASLQHTAAPQRPIEKARAIHDEAEKARIAAITTTNAHATTFTGLATTPPGAFVGLNLTNGEELYDRKYDPRKFVIDGLVTRGTLALLAGRPKSGKSWLLLQLAAAIDAGASFLGKATSKSRVLYMPLEDGERRIYERIHVRKWRPAMTHFAFNLMPLTGDGLMQIEHAIGDFDVLVIDTLRAACGPDADENDNSAMGGIVQSLADLAHRHDKTIFITHHTRKGDAEDAFDLIRGAGAIRGAYDLGMIIQRKQKEAEAILRVESRDIEVEDMTIRFDGAAGWSYEGNGERIDDIRAGRAVITALKQMGDGQTSEAIASHLGISKQAAYKQLKSALEENVITRTPQPASQGRKPTDFWSLRPETAS